MSSPPPSPPPPTEDSIHSSTPTNHSSIPLLSTLSKLSLSLTRPTPPTPKTSSTSTPPLRTSPLDTSSILYPTLTTHPSPIPHHILIMSLSDIAQSPPTISNDNLFDILLRRLEPWVGEQGEGGYVLIVFAAEQGEVYNYTETKSSRKLPGVGWWIWKYKRIPRKYRKNLKRLYIVHPSLFTRTLLPLVLPFLSPKSYSKLHPLQSLLSLVYTHGVPLKGIDITMPVLQAEASILRDQPDLIPLSSASALPYHRPVPRRQSSDSSLTSWSYQTLTSAVGTAASYLTYPVFGSSTVSQDINKSQMITSGYWHRDLTQLVQECGGNVPPLFVELRKVILEECSGTMGIFRRASSSSLLTPIEALLAVPLDAQPNLPWRDIARQYPLFPPKIFNRVLAELQSPIIKPNLYPMIRTIKSPEQIKSTFLPLLPEARRVVLGYVIHMFHHLLPRESQIKMSAFNYATVLAPCLIAGTNALEDAQMCLEPGKRLPEAMRKAMGGNTADENDDTEEKDQGTLVGLLEMWIKEWPTVSASDQQKKEDENEGEACGPDHNCKCSWGNSGVPSPTSSKQSTSTVVGTPATAPAPANLGSPRTSTKKRSGSGSIRHSLLGRRSHSAEREGKRPLKTMDEKAS